MGTAICTECGTSFAFDVLPRRGKVCFKCHLGGVSLGFAYGKEQFHGPTIRERQAKQVADAKINGIDIQPIGSRWV